MKSLERQGMSLESTTSRLAAYSRVQNTYITIFTVLGGLGTLLGTVGVGILIARNVIERRGELAVMKAIGFRNKSLIRMLLAEHSTLLIGGVVIGLIASLLTISPRLFDGSTAIPLVGILCISALISAGGVFFCLLASSLALRGSFRESITKE
jgi:ABC-type antimicrobial peptide transport system permease subunit